MYLSDIEAFDNDPRVSGVYSKFQCNQPACEGKPHDALHKSLSVNMESGVWHCFRCSAHGVLEDEVFDASEYGSTLPASWQKQSGRTEARQRMKSKFTVADPD